MSRRAFTLIETIVTLAVAALILGTAIALWVSTGQMSRVADLAGGLQEAALAMAIIEGDLVQAVRKPDPAVDRVVRLTDRSAQLVRAAIAPDGTVSGKLVVYRFIKQDGTFRVRRRAGGEEQLLPGVFDAIAFDQLDGAGGPFVRVTLSVAVHGGGPSDRASDHAVLTALVRTCGPELIQSEAFAWPDLDAVRQVPFETGPEY